MVSQARFDDADPLGPMTTFMQGIILYRQWMIQSHGESRQTMLTVCRGARGGLQQLGKAT